MGGNSPSSASDYLTRGRLLARNAFLNAVGYLLPTLVALFSIPPIIGTMGKDRFGALSLVWMALGYFSLLDLGLGRAMTKLVAERIGMGDRESIPGIVWTSLFFMLLVGIAAVPLVVLASPWIVRGVLKVPLELQHEAVVSLRILGCCIPAVICTSGLIGVLEAMQQFGRISACRLANGIFVYASPLLALHFSRNLAAVVAVLAAGRVAGLLAYFWLCILSIPSLRRRPAFRRDALKPMLIFGGWITVSNIVDPLMTFLDRFLLGALLSLEAVAFYAGPYEIVTKLWIFPVAVAGVAFPAFSTALAQDVRRAAVVFRWAFVAIFAVLFPVVLAIVLYAYEGLALWLGTEFARHGAGALKILAVGVFVNSLHRVPEGLLKAGGRPDLMSKLHLVELPLYAYLAWRLITAYGVAGAAMTWLMRVLVETSYTFALAPRFLRDGRGIMRQALWAAGATILLLFFSAAPLSTAGKLAALSAGAILVAAAIWVALLSAEERAAVKRLLKWCMIRP